MTALEVGSSLQPRPGTRAMAASEKGLEGLAEHILKQPLTRRGLEDIVKESISQ